ncbi:hypothetical protein AA0488_0524 [Kozakia baliensis NRIC 0488]|nr:hypothetical protein AA0488_0524 [Kozakia baliensis NRIC 0488]
MDAPPPWCAAVRHAVRRLCGNQEIWFLPVGKRDFPISWGMSQRSRFSRLRRAFWIDLSISI